MDIHRSRFVPYPVSPISAIAFSRSSDKGLSEPKPALKLAIGKADGSIEIWDPSKGDWVQEVVFPGGDKKSIDGLLWTQEPDEADLEGKPLVGQLRLFSIGSTAAVTEWNLGTGRPLRASTGNFSEVWCFAAQPRWKSSKTAASQIEDADGEFRGQNIVAGCGDGTLALLSTADDDLVFKRFLARSGSRKAKCMSIVWQNRDTVIAGFTDSNIRIYDARNGSLKRNMSLGVGIPGAPRDTLVWRIKCLPNGDIVSADSNGEVRFWDGRTYSMTQRVTGHESDCLEIVTSSDGQTVFSGGMDGKVAVYKLGGKEGERRRWARTSHKRLHHGDIKSMAVYDAKSMSVVVSGGLDASPVVTPLRNYSKELYRRVPGLPQITPCATAPAQRLLVSWWADQISIWRVGKQSQEGFASDEKSRTLVARILVKGNDQIVAAAISHDGRALAVSTSTATKLFQLRPQGDAQEDRLRVRTVDLPGSLAKMATKAVDFSADGRWLAVVSLDNEVFIARVATSPSFPQNIELLANVVELDTQHRKHAQQSGLKSYERTITRMTFSSDSSVLVAANLAGYLDSWVLEGHFDSTAPAMDTVSRSDHAGSEAASSSSSDSDSDSDDEEEATIFYGQHWTNNKLGSMLPKLDSAPLILSFRPLSPSAAAAQINGNPGIHPTRHNPHAHSHALPQHDSQLLVITAHHQVYEFDILAGRLSDWSRRNPTSVLPPELRSIKDRAMGVIWDVRSQSGEAESQGDRIWLYGSSWVGMLDLSQDFAAPAQSVRRTSDAAISGEEAEGAVTVIRKRKRRESEKWSQLDEKRRKLRGASGAGDRVDDSEREGAPKSLRRIGAGGEAVDVDLDARMGSDDEDDEGLDGELGPLRRTDGQDLDGEDDEGGELAEGLKRKWWCTYKYRPILGMLPIGMRSEGGKGGDGETKEPLEVVLVERPPWDLQQMKEAGR